MNKTKNKTKEVVMKITIGIVGGFGLMLAVARYVFFLKRGK